MSPEYVVCLKGPAVTPGLRCTPCWISPDGTSYFLEWALLVHVAQLAISMALLDTRLLQDHDI